MVDVLGALADLDGAVTAGRSLTRDEAARVAACPDLVAVGALAEAARVSLHGRRVTFARVRVVGPGETVGPLGAATEVRLTGPVGSLDDARRRVREARRESGSLTLTGFSLADLAAAVGEGPGLVEFARALASDGLAAVSESPIDRLGARATTCIRAVRAGGLAVDRITVDRADPSDRFPIIERVAALQAEVGGIRAFSPLSRMDSRETPATGYDDVKTIAIGRLRCREIPSIQVDWPLYGPKLAQVAIAYGADDIDGVAHDDDPAGGPRRAARAEIERQIRAAGAEPAERDGRFAVVS